MAGAIYGAWGIERISVLHFIGILGTQYCLTLSVRKSFLLTLNTIQLKGELITLQAEEQVFQCPLNHAYIECHK